MTNRLTFTQAMYKWIWGDPREETAGGFHVSAPTSMRGNDGSLANTFEAWVSEAYENNEVVCGAINLIVNTFNEAEIKVIDSDGTHLELSRTQQLLNFINEDQTTRQFFSTILMHMYFGGCSFVEKIRDRNNRVTGLAALRPDRVTMQITPELGLSHYEFRMGGRVVRLEKEDIIWIPFVSPKSPYSSFSPLWALLRTVNSDNAAKAHSEELLNNRGRPGSLITTDQELDPEQAHVMAKSWDNSFKGSNNGSTGILWGGARYETIGMTMKDLDFTGLRKVDEAKVLSTLRVPLSVYGSITGSDASTYNNMKEAKKQLWEQCILPLQTIVLDALNNDKELIIDGEIIFDNSEVKALQDDMTELANRAKILYKDGGIITLNEARLMQNLDPLDGGDEIYTPPVPSFGISQPIEEDKPKPQDNQKAEAIEEPKKIAQLDAALIKKNAEDDIKQQIETILGRESIANGFLRKTKLMASRHLKAHIQDTILALGESKGHKQLKQFERNRVDKELQRLQEQWQLNLDIESADVLGQLIREAAKHSAKELGVTIDMSTSEALRVINDYTVRFSKQVSQTSYDGIKKVLVDSYEEGLTISDTSKRIQDLGTQWSKSRADTIARTETSRAANKGARVGYEKAGVTKLVFSAILDGNTSDICQALNGKVVGINDNFIDKDGNSYGTDLAYTQGVVQEPPCHPNCRSAILPVIE